MERRRRVQAPGETSSRPGGDGAASRSPRGALSAPPAPREVAPSMATRAAAVRRALTRSAVAERRRRLSKTGGCCSGYDGGADDPRSTSAATGASRRPGKDVVSFGGRGRATAAQGERPVGSRCCWLEAMVMDAALLTLNRVQSSGHKKHVLSLTKKHYLLAS